MILRGLRVFMPIDHGVPAHLLELELTEGSLMDNTARTISILNNMEKRGVHISIDDFGTGYSSLAYLRRFPVNKLKIDIAFIRDIMTNPDAAAIALAIIGMAHNLKLQVIAEGVETEAQLNYLQLHKCDQIQGYYFSPPLKVSELEKILHDKKHLPASASNVSAQQQQLLLLDENSETLAALKELLQADGYDILNAQSVTEALALLALHPVQVILCDQPLSVQGDNGFLDQVKNLYPRCKTIVHSAQHDLETITNAIYSGLIFRFYTKPHNDQKLRDNIRQAFQQFGITRSQ